MSARTTVGTWSPVLLSVLGLLADPSASAARGSLVDAHVAIDGIGPVAVPLRVHGATVFVTPADLITGEIRDVPYANGVVQLVTRGPDGVWIATAVAVDVVRGPQRVMRWTLPAERIGCHESRPPFDVAAVLASHRLPVGRLDPFHAWTSAVRSAPVTISCARFEQSSLDILDVGYTPVRLHYPPRVSHYEDVRVRGTHVPPGAIVQLCLQPIENPRVWCQDGAHPLVHDEWFGTAFIGRPDIRRGPGGLEFVDLYSRFWMRALIVRAPLPVRITSGITPEEWLAFRPLVLKESRPVEVIRAFRPGQVRVVIVRLGDATDGRINLADPITRVEGQFRPLPGYVRTGREIITVLVRRLEDKDWSVAGAATLGGDLTHWLIPAANLDPRDDAGRGERIAIAVVTRRALPPDPPVTEAMLRQYATSVSDEVRFTLFRPGEGAR